jgi:hypothetical protein
MPIWKLPLFLIFRRNSREDEEHHEVSLPLVTPPEKKL